MLVSLLALFAAPALAGDGPWTLSGGDQNLFLGADWYRYQAYTTGDGSARDLSSGVTASGVTGFWTMGLSSGVELEVKVPYEVVRVDDPDHAPCDEPPRAGWCAPSAGLGDVGLRFKGRVVDELRGAPLSMALFAAGRSGEAYAPRRGRLTTLGDGQTDVGGGLSLGRTDVVGQGWYRASAETTYWARFPHRTTTGDGGPADEVSWATTAILAPRPRFSLGPTATGFHRLAGTDLADADLSDVNAFTRLEAAQIQAGAKLAWYGQDDGPTFALTVLRTVWSRNNPADTLVISVGVGWFRPRPGAGALPDADVDELPLPDLPPPPAPPD